VLQFEIYQNPSERSRPVAPYVVVLQSHLLASMPTAIVAPLLVDDGRTAYTETSVSLTFDGANYVLSAAELVAIDTRHLQKPLGDLRDYEDLVRRALDRIFTGF
jgi:toxin CcdB